MFRSFGRRLLIDRIPRELGRTWHRHALITSEKVDSSACLISWNSAPSLTVLASVSFMPSVSFSSIIWSQNLSESDNFDLSYQWTIGLELCLKQFTEGGRTPETLSHFRRVIVVGWGCPWDWITAAQFRSHATDAEQCCRVSYRNPWPGRDRPTDQWDTAVSLRVAAAMCS